MTLVMIVAITVAVVAVTFVFLAKRLVYVSEPNEALIFSGATRRSGGREFGYRVVRGGRGIRLPLLESVARVDLSNLNIDVNVVGAYSKGGIPLNVHGVANVKMPSTEPLLNNAIERFLGRSNQDIGRVAKETLEGNLRGVLAQLTPEQVNEDKESFARMLLDEAEHDMSRMGLVLDNLKIQSVTDDSGYLNSIGRIQGAIVRQTATIAEAVAQADAAEQQAKNWVASEMSKLDADLAIAIQETRKRVVDASTRREALIAEANGEVKAQLANILAEIEREKARLLQVERQLEADVVRPAEADCRAREEQARGEAATIVERGRAEAAALAVLAEAFLRAGPAAREVLMMQKLVPLLGQIAGAGSKLRVRSLTVLPSAGDAAGGDMARQAVGAAAQIKAATGLDMAAVLRNLGSSGTAAPPPALTAPPVVTAPATAPPTRTAPR